MSSHRLDVSGSRPLSTTLNDPAATIAQTTSKAGDDVTVILGGLREIRLAVDGGARIERRRYVRRKQRYDEHHRAVRIDGEFQYDEEPYEMLVLVLAGSSTIFGRASFLDDQQFEAEEAGRSTHEPTPHTTVTARRWQEPHVLEQGELLEQLDVAGMIEVTRRADAGKVSGGSDEIGAPGTLTGRDPE